MNLITRRYVFVFLVVGAIAELSVTQANIDIIKNEDGLAPLIRLINTNGPELLVNVSRALGECANDKDALERMRRQDGVRLLWSLLKHNSEHVQVCTTFSMLHFTLFLTCILTNYLLTYRTLAIINRGFYYFSVFSNVGFSLMFGGIPLKLAVTKQERL